MVVGATGTIGREVVGQLAVMGRQVRAVSRNPETAGLPLSVEAVHADLARPETLDRSLEGIETVFLIWTAPPATAEPALERIANRAKRIIYLSAPLNVQHPFFQKPQPNPSSVLHARIERLIEASGLEWTFLRPGMFAANALWFWGPQIRAGDVVRWPHLAAPTAPIDERDIAAVAVRALCEEGHTAVRTIS